MDTQKIDPHHHEHFYATWKEKGMLLEGLSKANKEILIAYLNDMEIGRNVSVVAKKGPRGYGRLRNLKSKLHGLLRFIQESSGKDDVRDVTEDDLLKFFNAMRKGDVASHWTGKPFTATGTYIKAFKAFWHWYMLVSRKEKKEIQDITLILDAKDEKPKFNYFTIDQLQLLCNNAKFNYKVMMMFLFDSGIRAPTELMNVKYSDLEWSDKHNFYTLNIREETSKTFGRKIKLLLCSDILKQFFAQNNFKPDDHIFTVNYKNVNKYLRELGYRILKIGSVKEEKESAWVNEGLTMYDFRHSSACYWLPRYKSESSLKYRFGWKKSDMIHYYTELLGMKDTIQQDDLYVDITKTELERDIQTIKKDSQIKEEAYRSELDSLKEELAKRKKYDEILDKLMENPEVIALIEKSA